MSYVKLLSACLAVVAGLALDQAQAQVVWTPIPNYFGAAFSPYVDNVDPTTGQYPYWNSYSLQNIEQMLNITLTYHNIISTYSMGVNVWNVDSPWDQADSNVLVGRAAANVNKARNALGNMLTVSLGVYQQSDPSLMAKEISNAFSAAQDANTIYPGTVWGIVFTNEYVTDNNTAAQVLQMIQSNRANATNLGIKLGTRINTCWEINNGPIVAGLTQIAKAADFVMCNIYPGTGITNYTQAVQNVNDQFMPVQQGFHAVNPALEVIIGETGWPSQGQSFNNDASANTIANEVGFWNGMRTWAKANKVKVHIFEAFDEPWKGGDLPGEAHYGWWYRLANNQPIYIEKATGKQFQ